MEVNFIKALVDLFTPFFMQFGFGESLSRFFSVLLTIALLFLVYQLYKHIKNRWQNHQTAKDLAPFWEYPDIQKARQYFIPTRGQNVAPNMEESEPEDGDTFVFADRLIPFFLKKVFNDKKKSKKFHLVLAGSGMGKTTFMLNLYVTYHAFWSLHRRKFKMVLIPFKRKNILEEIKAIDKKEAVNTILLLDAFDEDRQLLQLHNDSTLTDSERFRKRLNEILEVAQDFRRVVITSRTQYFPEIQNKLYELKIDRYDGQGFHKLGILYISPFNQQEVTQYLNKKYGIVRFWNRNQKRKAQQIIDHSPNLMVRPMLLNYIDYLVNSEQEFHNTYEIYEAMVEKWLQRETDRQPQAKQNQFKADLFQFSQLIAFELFQKRTTNLDKQTAINIASKHNLQLKNYEITGKSLLTRDGNGNWKFAHKSILEYFIAKDALTNINNYTVATWNGFDMAQSFFNEVFLDKLGLEMIFVEGGRFYTVFKKYDGTDATRKVTVSDFSIGKYPVTQKQWEEIMGYNPSAFKGEKHPVENISWEEVELFIKKLNYRTGMKFRLPTEAEWEYAYRDGKYNKGYVYANRNVTLEGDLHFKNITIKKREVGLFKPNILGLYDMKGSIGELCEDDWHDNFEGAPDDSRAWIEKPRIKNRVARRGKWVNGNGKHLPLRFKIYYMDCKPLVGFRLSHS